MDNKAIIERIGGCEGDCLALNDMRIAGNKPWGGGTVKQSWNTTIEDILRAISDRQKEDLKVYTFWYNAHYKVTIERVK